MFLCRKISATILFFTASTVFAGSMGPVETTTNANWLIGGSALYLKPSFGGYVLPGTLSGASGTPQDYANWSPDWGWGFRVEGSYHFNTGNDLNLNMSHVAHSNNFVFSQLTDSVGTSNLSRTGTSDISYNWNTVNLEFGQTFDFSKARILRFHAGVKYTRVTTETQSGGTLTLLGSPSSFTRSLTGFFYGYGPRVGVDASSGWNNGFGLYANAALSLLIGNKGFSDTITYAGSPNSYNASYFAMATGLEAKLGAKYTHAIAQGALTLDGGWMFVDTLNALPYRLVLSTTDSATRESDFALQGPYVGLKWLGNIG